MSAMNSPPTALFFTYPEHGQANVILATSYELALAGVDVHIASFASLKSRIERLQEFIVRRASHSSGPLGSVNFRECRGFTPWMEAIKKHGITPASLPHPHGVSGAVDCYSKLGAFFFPWDQEEYLAAIESCKDIIAIIRPNMVLVDNLFCPPIDACKLLKQRFTTIFPTAVSDVVAKVQPYAAAFWKYPVMSSGFPFPLEWWQIPLNIYLNIRQSRYRTTSENVKQIQDLRQSLGITSATGSSSQGKRTYISPGLPEIDFPLVIVPKEMHHCGPIIMPFDPLEQTDPGLTRWLDHGPTVMINLGSHVLSDTAVARGIAGAIQMLFNHHDRAGGKKVQVLWKVKASGDIERVIDEMIGKEMKENRVKAIAWLDAEPVSILQHPNVVCTVHHGGATSFYEGIWSGMPHIVLPVWTDTYLYASRVEFLNVGIFGNKSCAPGVRAEEFGKALVKVTGDTQEADLFKTTAKRLREVCRAKGSGRKLASLVILKEIGWAQGRAATIPAPTKWAPPFKSAL